MFEDEVTIFHLNNKNEYTGMHFKEVYFKTNKIIQIDGQIAQNKSSCILRIPTKNELEIVPNDYVIEGNIKENWNYKNFIKKYDVYKIISVAENLRESLSHYKIEGEQ